MTIETSHIVQITNDRGGFPNHAYDREPEPGSVVLTEGEFGTAWQRQFSTGDWRCVVSSKSVTWDDLLKCRNLVLVYDAPVRGEQR